MESLDPDLACFQEIGPEGLDILKAALPHHGVAVRSSKIPGDPTSHGELCPIFFKKSRFSLLEDGQFWLSETPHQPSRSFDFPHAQTCAWVRLRTPEGLEFRVFNTHFGHGKETRQRSLQLLGQMVAQDGPTHQIVVGDFNTVGRDPSWTYLSQAGLFRADEARATLHLYGISLASLDSIWATGPLKKQSVEIVKGRNGLVYPSDHFGLLAKFQVT